MIKIDTTKKYALAVSGGVDSMVMLHKFASLSPRPDFFVVTVNHNIRKEAQSDCDFVCSYCDSLQVECRVFSVDVPAYAKENKLSEETAARILRYRVLDGLQCDYVCLAHHAGDNAETVLMHILRGSGAYGAEGIKQINGRYLRPILELDRASIERYAKEHNVPYVNDSTNDETKYTRNFIRQKVLPLLKEVMPNAEKNIVRFAENIAEDNEYLDSLVDVSEVLFEECEVRIPLSLLLQPRPIAYRVLRKVFQGLGVYKDVEKTHVEALYELARGQGGKSVNLPFGYVAVNDYDYMTIEQQSEDAFSYFEIPFKQGVTETPTATITVSKTKSDNALQIDLNKIPSDAVFRPKKQGDVFEKFGGGEKTLKKYLIDKKVPQRKRSELVLVATGSEVLVICGVEISDKVRTDGNSDIYYITVKRK